MVATPSSWTRRQSRVREARRPSALVLAVLAFAVAGGGFAAGQNAQGRAEGLFIPVPGRIDSNGVNEIKAKVEDALKRQPGLRTVVFDFNPDNQPTGTSDFGTCLNLSKFIRTLRAGHPGLTTVAFVHGEVTRHTVLPVLTCQDLIMSRGARLGNVLRDQEGELSEVEAKAYEAVARPRSSPDLVWKLVHPHLVLREVHTRVGPRYVDEKTLEAKTPAERAQRDDLVKKWGPLDAVKGVPAGLDRGTDNTLFDSERARQYGLCRAVYNTGGDVARAYNLPPYALYEHALLGRTRVGWRIDLTSTVNKAKLDSLERRVKAAVGRGANVLILYLDCEGGDTDDVASTARVLAGLKDDAGVRAVLTIAYVPPGRALGAATFLALGCSQIVMGKGAALADFEYLKGAGHKLDSTRDMLVKLAEERGYPAALFRASLQPDLALYKARNKQDPAQYRVMTKQDLDEQAAQWEADGRIPAPPGGFLKIDAALARDWQVARFTDVDTAEDVYRQAELDPARVRVSRDDWLDKVAEFFREEVVKLFLIMLGILGLILELKLPGAGLPGIVAAICFVLFFWAHSFVGQFTMLAVFLFILGLVLIGLEIFVLPGFGVTGISGILLVVGSLVLVTLERMPETTQDWMSLGTTVTTLGVSLVAAIAGACVVAWYLPHIPYASRLVLQPPGEGDEGYDADALRRADAAAALLGAIGVAATTLRPAGKALFGEDYLDVIAEGDYVNPGSRVQVIEIEGNRIVVKEV